MKLRAIIESEYDELEDADEFVDSFEEACSRCESIFTVDLTNYNPDDYTCVECGHTVCADCEMAGGVARTSTICSRECLRQTEERIAARNKLRRHTQGRRRFHLGESVVAPIVRRVQWSPAVIYFQYPNGDVWEYVIYDDWRLKDLLKRYRRNVGRLVAEVKKIPGVEGRNLTSQR